MRFEVEVGSFPSGEQYVGVQHEPTNRAGISFAMTPKEALTLAAQLIATADEVAGRSRSKTGSPATNAKNS